MDSAKKGVQYFFFSKSKPKFLQNYRLNFINQCHSHGFSIYRKLLDYSILCLAPGNGIFCAELVTICKIAWIVLRNMLASIKNNHLHFFYCGRNQQFSICRTPFKSSVPWKILHRKLHGPIEAKCGSALIFPETQICFFFENKWLHFNQKDISHFFWNFVKKETGASNFAFAASQGQLDWR